MRTLQFGSGSKLAYGDAEKHIVVDGVAYFYDANGVLVGVRTMGEGDSVLEVEASVAPAPEPELETPVLEQPPIQESQSEKPEDNSHDFPV